MVSTVSLFDWLLLRRCWDQAFMIEVLFDSISWYGALVVMFSVVVVLWIIQIVNVVNDYFFDRSVGFWLC